MQPPVVWTVFFGLAAVIVYSGLKLSRYGDVIAEKTGLGRTWIGVILLALVTSLPEVATSCAAAFMSLPDIVFGNVFGSNLFNLIIIGVLDLLSRGAPALSIASRNHLLTTSYGAMMMALTLLPMLLYNIPGLGFAPLKLFGLVDLVSILIIALYIIGMRQVFRREQEDAREEDVEVLPKRYLTVAPGKAYLAFGFFAFLIIAAGIGMSYTADIIAGFRIEAFGIDKPIGHTLVGLILMAVATSLPELVVSIGAARLGAIDMAVGNVLGSNMFNMMIIGIADLFYSGGSLLNRPTVTGAAAVTGFASHMVTGLAGIVLTCIVAATLARRAKSRGRISAVTPVLFIVFILCYLILVRINLG